MTDGRKEGCYGRTEKVRKSLGADVCKFVSCVAVLQVHLGDFHQCDEDNIRLFNHCTARIRVCPGENVIN